jgi:glycosyltransferase involved in cell wall biosynthesis
LYRQLRKKFDVIIACSEEVRRSHLRYIDPSRFIVVQNGVDLKKFTGGNGNSALRVSLGLSEEDYVVGNIASLTPQKGQTLLLEAIGLLISEGIPAKLVVAGDGELKPVLEAKAKDLGIWESVRLLGKRKDVPALLQIMDVVAVSSFWEGLPVSILEAMAAGRPIVATNVGGNPEAVVDNVTGILIPLGEPSMLASALGTLFQDENLRLSLGVAARAHVKKHFTLESMVSRTEKIYERLLQSKGLSHQISFSGSGDERI